MPGWVCSLQRLAGKLGAPDFYKVWVALTTTPTTSKCYLTNFHTFSMVRWTRILQCFLRYYAERRSVLSRCFSFWSFSRCSHMEISTLFRRRSVADSGCDGDGHFLLHFCSIFRALDDEEFFVIEGSLGLRGRPESDSQVTCHTQISSRTRCIADVM